MNLCLCVGCATEIGEEVQLCGHHRNLLPPNAEILRWHSAEVAPDAEETVLIFQPSGDDPVWLGFYDYECGGWRDVSGELTDKVTHWATVPAGIRRVS